MIQSTNIINRELFSKDEFDKMRIRNLTNKHGEHIVRIDGEIPPKLEIKKGDRFFLGDLSFGRDSSCFTQIDILTKWR